MVVILTVGTILSLFVLRSPASPQNTSTNTISVTSPASSTISLTITSTSVLTTILSTNTYSGQTSSSHNSLVNKIVEIKAFEVSQGKTMYTAGNNFTATQLLSLVQQIHTVVGNFSIIRFIRVQCNNATVNPNLPASEISGQGFDWNGTLNSYVAAIQQAAGGQIIPDADMDLYLGQADCGSVPNPTGFFANTASLLGLTAIANGEHYVMLEAWDAWYKFAEPNESGVENFFQEMRAQGWEGFIPQVNGPNSNNAETPTCSTQYAPYVDYGYGTYVRNGIFVVNLTSPYVFPNLNAICSIHEAEPYLDGVLIGIESQLQANNPAYDCGDIQYEYAIQAFAQCLTVSQQETALLNLAQNQRTDNYIFIYPVVVGEYSVLYNAQQEGTLTLMEQLMNQYGG